MLKITSRDRFSRFQLGFFGGDECELELVVARQTDHTKAWDSPAIL